MTIATHENIHKELLKLYEKEEKSITKRALLRFLVILNFSIYKKDPMEIYSNILQKKEVVNLNKNYDGQIFSTKNYTAMEKLTN